jgi:hypothetical protein
VEVAINSSSKSYRLQQVHQGLSLASLNLAPSKTLKHLVFVLLIFPFLLTWNLQINLVANHVLNPNSQVFVGFANNIIEGEATKVEKLVTKECVLKRQFTNLKKRSAKWKPHNHNLVTWVFYQVNNNQPINFNQNQIIVCHH